MLKGEGQRFEVVLSGCRPEPLAAYLKALGVLRLVAEQKDRDACGFWRGETFVLSSRLDEVALTQFLSAEWCPTPVIAPWNGGSGFYPKDAVEARDAILASKDPRLGTFKDSINVAMAFVARQGWTERPADEEKVRLVASMRALLPDAALAWLDAVLVIGTDKLLFPPLLGTGGNDGRLDFSNNYQQRVVEVFGSQDPRRLQSSLFGVAASSRFKGTMGQYLPAADERTNPWDFVFLIEGALVFAGAATRRLESSASAKMAFPFHVRAAGGVSTVAESDEGEGRDELWLPLWSRPATIRDVRKLFSEGRATVGSGDRARPAASALDFARAVASLGTDRGVDAFQRVGFHVRNGLAYFATPLGRYPTRDVPSERLLDDVDRWFERLKQKTNGKGVPARVAVASRRLEQALFDAVSFGRMAPVLLELGRAEQALSRSLSFAEEAGLRSVPTLRAEWLDFAEDTVEVRLAKALAARPGIGVRLGRVGESAGVFADRPLVDNLHALLLEEDIERVQRKKGPPEEPRNSPCSLVDIGSFVEGDVDDELIERWLRAVVLVKTPVTDEPRFSPDHPDGRLPPALFAVLAVVQARRLGRDEVIPRTNAALNLACAGDATGASAVALRRLQACGRSGPVSVLFEPTARTRRIAAALAFPLTTRQRRCLESMVLPIGDSPQCASLQETP